MRERYTQMKRGYNCKPNYDPLKMKYCTKCPNKDSHHEFECPNYDRYSKDKCSNCLKYYHFTKECEESKKFPPDSKN